MFTTDRIKELEEARAKVASLEQAIAAELNKELAALPARYGFGSVADFGAAVTKATGKRRGRKPGKAKAEVAPVTAVKKLAAVGLEVALRRGKRLGRPPLDPKIVRLIHDTAARLGHHVRAIAREIHVPPSTVCRVLARGGLGAGQPTI